MSTDRSRPGLYVHVPFCARKCRYCAFASSVVPHGRPGFVDALLQEADRAGAWDPFDTLYLGGGTPTVLSDEDLDRLWTGLHRRFRFTDDLDATLEANPDDLDASRLSHLRDLGFNRLSLGVQSFDDGLLTWLGRRHDATRARRVLESIRDAGFCSVSVDLMLGLPGQDAIQELETALSFAPDHLSCYQLTFEPGTPLDRDRRAGRVRPLPEDDAADLFLATSDHLTTRGWIHYEVSSFARTRDHISRHNWKYWFHVPYLGLGPSACSYRDGRRWWNRKTVASWKKDTLEGQESLTPEDRDLEELALGLRTERGILRPVLPPSETVLADALMAGLLLDGDRVRPTPRGMLVADRLAVDLHVAIRRSRARSGD